ncbi:MAG: class II aldolase/adducin family protein [Clostridia bacterium]|nr:class II aldolase/adducin family protein [Clostridia bacterium]
MSFVKDHMRELELFSRMSCQIGCRPDYVQGGGGNTSMKTNDGRMAIKASGFKLNDITPSAGYALIDYKPLAEFYLHGDPASFEDVEKAGSDRAKELTLSVPELPSLRPSVEAGFHSILDKYVIHSHSVYSNLAACALECDSVLESALNGVPYIYTSVPYTNPGAKLTFIIRDAIRATEKRRGIKPAVIVMRNHGLIVTHDDIDQVLRIHEDVNVRLAKHFGIKINDFPLPAVAQQPDGSFISATPYLAERLKTGRYTPELFLNNPLYPDQMVFFRGTLLETGEALRDGACAIDVKNGTVTYRVRQAQAQVLEETLCAVIFIHETLERAALHIQYMGQDARSFIENWESEKYRKSLNANK